MQDAVFQPLAFGIVLQQVQGATVGPGNGQAFRQNAFQQAPFILFRRKGLGNVYQTLQGGVLAVGHGRAPG